MGFWNTHKRPAQRSPQQERELEKARRDFHKFESTPPVPASAEKSRRMADKLWRDFTIDIIESQLKKAGAGYADLDPSGERSGDEIRGVLLGFRYRVHVDEARDALAQLKVNAKRRSIDIEPEYYLKKIHDELQKAGADFAALDPEGKISAHEMKTRVVPQAVRDAHFSLAVKKFDTLAEGIPAISALAAGMVGGKPLTPERVAGEVRDHLKKAGRGLAALDPKGQKTDREMAQELNSRVANHEFRVDDPEKFRKQVGTLSTMPRGGGRGR